MQKESNLKVVWNGGIYDFDAWAIPKGLDKARAEAAKKFIAFSVAPQQQKTYSENIANQVQIDVSFWADNGEQLEQRFNSWAAK